MHIHDTVHCYVGGRLVALEIDSKHNNTLLNIQHLI